MEEQEFNWVIYDDDIALALQECGCPNGSEDINEVREYLDEERVVNAAAEGITLNEKSKFAIENIVEQIREN